MAKSNWKSLERRRVNFDDDLVIVYDEDDREIYRGLEDYEPMKDEPWKWDNESQSYKLDKYRKICLDI